MAKIIVSKECSNVQGMNIEPLGRDINGVKLIDVPPGSYDAEVEKRIGGELMVIKLGNQVIGCSTKSWKDQGASIEA